MKLKNFVFRAARSTRLLSVVADSEWRRKRLTILCYHGVSYGDEHAWNPELYITQERLCSRLDWLRKHSFEILPLPEALQRLDQGILPKRAVSLTFDDGTKDFADRALPILAKYTAPVTLYLTTFYCLQQYPVFDTALSYLLWRGRASGADLAKETELPHPVPVDNLENRSKAGSAIQALANRRQLDAGAKNELLGAVAGRLGIDFDAFVASGLLQLMGPEQVHSLPRDLVDIQLHTHRHKTPANWEAFYRELHLNQQAIATLSGDQASRRHFCYPSNLYDERFFPWLRALGIESATTCVPGLASPKSNPLLLPRFVDTMHATPETYAAWASGFADFLPRRATICPSRLVRALSAPYLAVLNGDIGIGGVLLN